MLKWTIAETAVAPKVMSTRRRTPAKLPAKALPTSKAANAITVGITTSGSKNMANDKNSPRAVMSAQKFRITTLGPGVPPFSPYGTTP